MSQIIQHRRGSLANIKTLNTSGPVHRGEILVATGSLYMSSGSSDSDNYHLSASIFFGGSLTTDGSSNYRPITQVISGSGLPSVTTGTYGRSLDGILYINTDDNKLYRLVAEEDANPATSGNFTGSHQLISGGGGSGTIGPAEDGSYADGLFTDFTQNTLIGTPIDRFNEVLKALAPSPATYLDNIDGNETAGVAGDLSFGSSNTISGVSNVTAVGALGAVDVNSVFAESGDRFGIFKFSNSQSFEGDLNEDVSQGNGSPNPAYPANAFTDANIGVIHMEVNGTLVTTASLSSSDSGFTRTGTNGSTITVSAVANAKFPDGTELDVFKNRTGNYSVALADQRPGHNYVQIKHVKPGSTIVTNYVDWVIDDFRGSSAIGINDTGSWSFVSPGTLHTVSGIKYYANGFESNGTVIPYTASYTNLYRDTYPSSGNINLASTTNVGSSEIKITGPGLTTSTQTFVGGNTTFNYAELNTGVTDCHTTDTTMSVAITPAFDDNEFHHPADWSTTYGNDDVPLTFALNVSPLHRSTLNGGTVTETDYLYNSLTVYANEYQFEDFKDEEYRQSYDEFSIGSTADTWDTTATIAGTNDAALYNTYLVYPTKVGNNGNLSTVYGPGSQVDYSSETGTRHYVRYFKARSDDAGSKEWALEFIGTGRIVSGSSTQFATNDEYFKVEVMRGSAGSAGINNNWVDPINPAFRVGTGFSSPNTQYIPVTSTVSYSTTTIGGITVPQGVVKFQDADGTAVALDEVLGVRIILPQGFTGNIDAMALRYGSSTASQTALLGSTYTNY